MLECRLKVKIGEIVQTVLLSNAEQCDIYRKDGGKDINAMRRNSATFVSAFRSLLSKRLEELQPDSFVSDLDLCVGKYEYSFVDEYSEKSSEIANDEEKGDEDEEDDGGRRSYASWLEALPPNFNRDVTTGRKRKRSKQEPPSAVTTADSTDRIEELQSSDSDEDAGPCYEWSVEPRSKNPLLALATEGVVKILSELTPRLHTLRLCGWPLCQRSVARLLDCRTLPHLRRLSLATCSFVNMFTSLGPAGAEHSSLVELNLSCCTSAREPGDGDDDPNFKVMMSYLPALQRLLICDSWTQLTSDLLRSIATHCSDLREFVASRQLEGDTEEGFAFDDSAVRALVQACQDLEVLSLGKTCGEEASREIVASTPALRVWVEGAGSQDEEEIVVAEGRRGRSKRGGSTETTLPLPSTSSLEVAIISSGPVLRPQMFAQLVSAKIINSASLRHLHIGSCQEIFQLSVEVCRVIDSCPLEMLQVLCLPAHHAIDSAVLARLASSHLRSLLSWTHSSQVKAQKKDQTPWSVAALKGFAAPVSLQQVALGGFHLSPEFLDLFAHTFPEVVCLSLESYTLTPQPSEEELGAILGTLVVGFPHLKSLALPRAITDKSWKKSKDSFTDWFAFAVLRASIDENEDSKGILFPIPTLIKSALVDSDVSSHVSSALHRLVLNAKTLTQAGEVTLEEAARTISKLPSWLKVSVSSYGAQVPYDVLCRRLSGRGDASPYEKMIRHIPLQELDLHNSSYASAPAREFVVAQLKNPLLPRCLVEQHAGASQVSFGDDSDDDGDVSADSSMQYHRQNMQLARTAFMALNRRLRRNSPKVTKLYLPRILASVGGGDEDVSFQLTEEALSTYFESSMNNSVISEVIVHVYKNPEPLLLPCIRGLCTSIATWSHLRVLTLQSGVCSADATAICSALTAAYHTSSSCLLQNLFVTTLHSLSAEVVIAVANLISAASGSLLTATLYSSNPNTSSSSGVYTPESISCLQQMMTNLHPNAVDPRAVLELNFGDRMDDAREIAASVVRGIRVQRCVKLSMSPSPPQLRSDRKFRVNVDSVKTLLDAFIDNGGNLMLNDDLLAINVHKLISVPAARLLGACRALQPSYGLEDKDMYWFARALTKDSSSNRHMSIMPPPTFLNASVEEGVLAFQRILEIMIPLYRSMARSSSPTILDYYEGSAPHKQNDVFAYSDASFMSKEVLSLTERSTDDSSYPSTDTEVLSSFVALNDQPGLTEHVITGRSVNRQNFTFPGVVGSWLNCADLWFGSSPSRSPIVSASLYRSTEVARAHYWLSCPHARSEQLPVTCDQQLTAGPMFAVEMSVEQGSFTPLSSVCIHDDDSHAVLKYRDDRLAEESLSIGNAVTPTGVAKPTLLSKGIEVAAAYHIPEGGGRVVIFSSSEKSLTVRRFDGSNCFGLERRTRDVLCEVEGVHDVTTATVIDGVCIALRGSNLVIYNLWEAERDGRLVSGDEGERQLCADSTLDTSNVVLHSWCGDEFIFLATGETPTLLTAAHVQKNEDGYSLSNTSLSLKLPKEWEASYTTGLQTTPRFLAVQTLHSTHLFTRKVSEKYGEPLLENFRLIANDSYYIKLIPGNLFGEEIGDLLFYSVRAPRQSGPANASKHEGGQLCLLDLSTNDFLMRVVGVISEVSFGAMNAFNEITQRNDTIFTVGSRQLLSVYHLGERSTVSEKIIENESIVDFDVSSVIQLSPDAGGEKLRTSIRRSVSAFSGKKGGRYTKVREVIDSSSTELRAECVAFALNVAAEYNVPALATHIVEDCISGVLPLPKWTLVCPQQISMGTWYSYAMEEATIVTVSVELRNAVRCFLTTSLGAVICRCAEAAVRVLEADLSVSPSLVMLLAVIAYGFSTGGMLVHLHATYLPHRPDASSVERLLTLLLSGCEDKMLGLSEATLTLLIRRFEHMQMNSLVQKVKDLMVQQALAQKSASGFDVDALNAWYQHLALIEKVSVFVKRLEGPFDIFSAEKELEALEALIPVTSPPSPPARISENIIRVGINSSVPQLPKDNKFQGQNFDNLILQSIYRDYPPTLLCAACQGERVERTGEDKLEDYLRLRARLIVRLLQAGADVNRSGLIKSQYGVSAPSLPIDLLVSPTLLTVFLETCAALSIEIDFSRSTLLTKLVSNAWHGCRLSTGQQSEDPYEPRYDLLKRILEFKSITLTAIDDALVFIKSSNNQFAAMIAHEKLTNNTSNGNLREDALKFGHHAVIVLENALKNRTEMSS